MTGQSPRQKDLFAPSAEGIFSVSELAARVRALLEEGFALVRVIGEISDPTLASSGHAYFSLKDQRAAFPAVMFRAAVARVGGRLPAEGTEVECLGRLTLYEPRGRAQLVVEWMAPRGAGELGLLFLRLKERLQAEGVFDPRRKRPLPFLPGCIGVVTSPTGAAVRDILKVLSLRFPSIPVLICPVRVQGEGAAGEIAAAISRMGDGEHGDVLIVGRGGGSAEDLWAFNEEVVVRAIVASRVPVVSAVGHEVDLVLSDLAADARAPTPSAAAEMVVPDRRELGRRVAEMAEDLRRLLALRTARERACLESLSGRIRDPRLVLAAQRMRLDDAGRAAQDAVRRSLEAARRSLDRARVSLASGDPAARVLLGRSRLEGLHLRLGEAIRSRLGQERLRVKGSAGALSVLSPLAVLGRGYSVVTRQDGAAVRDSSQLAPGDPIRLRFHRGAADGVVQRVVPPSAEE